MLFSFSIFITNIFLIFINFLFFPPFFGTRIRSRSPHNELRFILHMIDADRLDLSIFLCARFHLFHDDVTGIHPLIYDKMFYRRKGNFFHLCEQRIVASHDRHISGHPVFFVIKCIHDPECDHVIEPHNGSQLRMFFQKLLCQIVSDPVFRINPRYILIDLLICCLDHHTVFQACTLELL